MLVLTRKIDEQIVIGDDIKVTLIRVRGNTVRLGIEAPRDVRIVRSELESLDESSDEDHSAEDREEAFAHPVANPAVEATQGKHGAENVGRISADRQPLNRITPVEEPSVFVGRVTRDGSQTELKRAPLSAFVSAS